MSIIGPRPGDVESKDTYFEDEKDKLLIRPGITGYTQAYYSKTIFASYSNQLFAWSICMTFTGDSSACITLLS